MSPLQTLPPKASTAELAAGAMRTAREILRLHAPELLANAPLVDQIAIQLLAERGASFDHITQLVEDALEAG